MADVSKLLHDSSAPCLTKQLDLKPIHDKKLKRARVDIRDHLRLSMRAAQHELFGNEKARPGFYTQGSYAYETINLPAHPFQQIDLDDGIYLPVSFLEEAGGPKAAADMFIEFVDKSLRQLVAQKHGWSFDDSKDTCARVVIDSETHVDIPMYAIPDSEFQELHKKAMARSLVGSNGAIRFAESAYDDNWDMIPTERVHLAHRKKNWVASDPRVVNIWFDMAIARHDEELRRVCRYLKAWRDHQAKGNGPEPGVHNVSSILLMACAVKVFDIHFENSPGDTEGFGGDDKALQQVVRMLPDMLVMGVPDPADPDKDLTDRLSSEDKRIAIELAKTFGNQLNSAIDTCHDNHRAVDIMIELFGSRIPQRPDLVGSSFKASPRAEVMAVAPAIVSEPSIPRTKSAE